MPDLSRDRRSPAQSHRTNDKHEFEPRHVPADPCLLGGLLDKITILQIKSERMIDAAKLANVRHELHLLIEVRDRQGEPPQGLAELVVELRSVNERLWGIEDAIRECERQQDFGARFIELARAVYVSNDRRAALKYRINHLMGSPVVEEKSYAAYGREG